MSKYVFLDFETANNDTTSVCQIGMMIFDNGKIEEITQNIKPIPLLFDEINMSIHGITEKDVKNSPTFTEFWPNISKYFNGDYVICCHNAGFDISQVLKKVFPKYNIENISFNYCCSMESIKKETGKRYQKYNLEYLTKKLEIPFENHHNALADAKIIYKIILKLYGSIENYEKSVIKSGYKFKKFPI